MTRDNHDYDYRKLPTWKRALINAKWKFIHLNRKFKGFLPILIVLVVMMVLSSIQQQMIAESLKPEFQRPICYSVCDWPL